MSEAKQDSVTNALDDSFPCDVVFRGYKYGSVEQAVLCESHRKELRSALRSIKSLKHLNLICENLKYYSEDKVALRELVRFHKFMQNEPLRRILMRDNSRELHATREQFKGIPYKQGDLFWTTLSS